MTLTPEYLAIAVSPHCETEWAKALQVGLQKYGPTPTYDKLRAHFEAHPVASGPCGLRWSGVRSAEDPHRHECRHSHGHPGRHVCDCRSWTS